MAIERVNMYHPSKKDEAGRPKIVTVNAKTVKSGAAAKMGYLPVPNVEKAPAFEPKPVTAPKVTPAPKAKA